VNGCYPVPGCLSLRRDYGQFSSDYSIHESRLADIRPTGHRDKTGPMLLWLLVLHGEFPLTGINTLVYHDFNLPEERCPSG
jgi:hypothetical protein